MPVTIPRETIKRLFIYYRALLESRETEVISSEELSQLTGFSAAQIRKDLTYFGQFGTPGRGYTIKDLTHQLKGILGIDREWEVALVGMGNMGRALVAYEGLKNQGFNVTQLFDSDPKKIGMFCAGLKIKNIDNLKEEIRNSAARIAILAVPAGAAQSVTNLLLEAGIKAILNFAPTRIIVPDGVNVLNIDITNELTRLSYYLVQPDALKIADDNPAAGTESPEPIA
ncbi:MAG TPA: redox-sensing transcriptional repressor Rex [Planctomycetota bacterium]|nr:redox-sensing transcriptional repressor Rex [Planctomycetota bacterium]